MSHKILESKWEPMGQALLDYYSGNKAAHLLVSSSVEADRSVPVGAFFRESGFPAIEKEALKACRGHLLDAGAGAGTHSVYLQEKGFIVTAIDVSPSAVELMSRRGVKDARTADIFALKNEKFDTILMMMNGIGVAKDLLGLKKLLSHLKTLLKPKGQVVFDSADINYMTPYEISRASLNDVANDYYGTVTYQLSYKGMTGQPYTWLFVDKETMRQYAEAAGFRMSVLMNPDEQYLATLVLNDKD